MLFPHVTVRTSHQSKIHSFASSFLFLFLLMILQGCAFPARLSSVSARQASSNKRKRQEDETERQKRGSQVSGRERKSMAGLGTRRRRRSEASMTSDTQQDCDRGLSSWESKSGSLAEDAQLWSPWHISKRGATSDWNHDPLRHFQHQVPVPRHNSSMENVLIDWNTFADGENFIATCVTSVYCTCPCYKHAISFCLSFHDKSLWDNYCREEIHYQLTQSALYPPTE